VTTSGDPDGSTLLTSADVKDLLSAAVEHAGGSLVSWRLDHVDASPRHSTTATYSAAVDWPTGRRTELLGASARVGGRTGSDERATIFGDGDREVAVWLYPDDPDLPGLRRAGEISVDPRAYFEESDPAMERLSRDVARTVVSAILENF